jgi:tetratricopeptide (TPR) repeat protein
VFTISNDALIEGSPLPAGRYGLHMIPEKDEWTIIFSKESGSWGSFFYDPSHDALRVKVKPHPHEYREWLAYEFPVRKPAEATAELQWEELAVPFSIKIDKIEDIYVSALRHELTDVPGFTAQGIDAAALYCVQANTHLDQALEWAETAVSNPFIGQVDFNTLSAKAQVLSKMGRDAEAGKIMQTALRSPTATAPQIHQYGRQLMGQKKNAEAMEVFKLNAERNGDAWPVHVGLARAYSAAGDLPKALEHAQIAVKQAPDELNRKSLQGMIEVLSKGKPIDQ